MTEMVGEGLKSVKRVELVKKLATNLSTFMSREWDT